jgi:hypothetical protein
MDLAKKVNMFKLRKKYDKIPEQAGAYWEEYDYSRQAYISWGKRGLNNETGLVASILSPDGTLARNTRCAVMITDDRELTREISIDHGALETLIRGPVRKGDAVQLTAQKGKPIYQATRVSLQPASSNLNNAQSTDDLWSPYSVSNSSQEQLLPKRRRSIVR